MKTELAYRKGIRDLVVIYSEHMRQRGVRYEATVDNIPATLSVRKVLEVTYQVKAHFTYRGKR